MAAVGAMPRPSLAAKKSPTPTLDVLPAFVLRFVLTVDWREPILMPLGLDKVRKDRFLAQCLASLKPMQTVHEHEAFAIAPDKDWGRLPDLKHTLRNLSHRVGVKRRTALYGHIDVSDR
jgi:hypothetical protein